MVAVGYVVSQNRLINLAGWQSAACRQHVGPTCWMLATCGLLKHFFGRHRLQHASMLLTCPHLSVTHSTDFYENGKLYNDGSGQGQNESPFAQLYNVMIDKLLNRIKCENINKYRQDRFSVMPLHCCPHLFPYVSNHFTIAPAIIETISYISIQKSTTTDQCWLSYGPTKYDVGMVSFEV